MAWLMLIVAGSFEVVWAIGLKYAEGFTKFWPSAMTIVAMLVSIVLLGESASAGRLASLALIVAGIVGLKLATP